MPTVTFTMSLADLEQLEKTLCGNAGLPISAENARKVQKEKWIDEVTEFQRRQAPVTPPVIT